MYKLISPSSIILDNILKKVCENRGVDYDKIINPSKDDTIHYSKLVNMDRAVQLIKIYREHYWSLQEKNEDRRIKVGIDVDSDADGMTSASSLYMYLEKHFPEFELIFYIHPGKQHGITDDVVQWAINNEVELLLVPDAGSMDFNNQEKLREVGIVPLILDHHEAEKDSPYAVIVNSQLSPEYTNKQFSGVGIVYKFLQALDDEFGYNGADEYLDLLAVGNVADVMDLTSPETRYYVYEGIKNIKNEAFKEMVFQFVGKWEKLNPTSIAFDIAPKINGVIRSGTQEEKEDLFKALIGHNLDEIHFNAKARTEANKHETFLKKAIRQAKNAYKRQNDSKKRWLTKFKDKVIEEGLYENPIIIIQLKQKDKFDKSLTGLIASNIAEYFGKITLIGTLNKEETKLQGSLRGLDSVCLDTKALFTETKLFNYVEGHANAAGFGIDTSKIDELYETLSELADESSENTMDYPVDFVIQSNQFAKHIVDKVESFKKHWGKGIDAPTFAITNIVADFKNIAISSGGMIRIPINGVEFVQFTADKRFVELAETYSKVTFDVVGTMGINSFMGKDTPTFIINDFEIKNIEESSKGKSLFIF